MSYIYLLVFRFLIFLPQVAATVLYIETVEIEPPDQIGFKRTASLEHG